MVREVLPGETEAVGELRVAAYLTQGLLEAGPGYADSLRRLGFDGRGTVHVAIGDADADGASGRPRAPTGGTGEHAGRGGLLLGTVMYDPWHPGSEVARSPDEAEVRALAVAPWAQGRGTGRALMRAVIGQAAASGVSRLLLSTQPAMEAAQHLYRSLGFARAPELDWAPAPAVPLLGFALAIPPALPE